MDKLKAKFEAKSKVLASEIKAFLKENASAKVDEVSVKQVFGGMRGIKSMLWETSQLDAYEGIRFRGYTIPELKELLPRAEGDKEPLPEGLFWLLLVDELPSQEEVQSLSEDWKQRASVPDYVFTLLDGLPENTHPMIQFSLAVASMSHESIFTRKYREGFPKSEYWDATYEDSMNLIAKLPRIAAYIYRKTYHNGNHIAPDPNLDWAANFAHMLGHDQEDFKSLMRLYLTIHADHEGGNASAHTVHLINSTLSDVYMSFAGGLHALAGPLHGLANQEVIKWIFELTESIGTTKPSKEQISDYVKKTISEGKVIPGYGHAVLRQPDPRFTAQRKFAEEYIKDDDLVNVVWKLFDVVPEILKGLGKVKNPWPNVDAHSGALLVHYGMSEYSFYTVMFGVSRALGVLANSCWSRSLGLPLERPKSLTFEHIKNSIQA